MNSKNSKTSHHHRLLPNLSDKIEAIIMLLYLAFTIHGKI